MVGKNATYRLLTPLILAKTRSSRRMRYGLSQSVFLREKGKKAGKAGLDELRAQAARQRGKVAGVVADWLERGYDLDGRWVEAGLEEVRSYGTHLLVVGAAPTCSQELPPPRWSNTRENLIAARGHRRRGQGEWGVGGGARGHRKEMGGGARGGGEGEDDDNDDDESKGVLGKVTVFLQQTRFIQNTTSVCACAADSAENDVSEGPNTDSLYVRRCSPRFAPPY